MSNGLRGLKIFIVIPIYKEYAIKLKFFGRIVLMAVNNFKLRPYTKWRIQNQKSYMPQINDFEWKILSETYENDHCFKTIGGKLSLLNSIFK